jgi:prolyl-tRNA editing enzyme YbaK/EbsC (Cys-tRNA(Pro) deacylase)
MNEALKFQSAINHPNLVGPSITSLLQNWQGIVPVEDIHVAEIDPVSAGGQDFCTRYGFSFNTGANCVIVEAVRNERRTLAACVSLVGWQLNLNTVVRKFLGARRVSLAPLDLILQISQMEYGSITPFGLPSAWPILLDSQILNSSKIVIGSGLLKSKLFLPTHALVDLPGAVVIEGLASIP